MSESAKTFQCGEAEFRELCRFLSQNGQELDLRSDALAQRLAEEAIFRRVIESLAEGLIITDRESRVLYANNLVTELTGFSREELLGRVSYEVLSIAGDWPAMKKRLSERLDGKTDFYEVPMTRKDGRPHWVSVKASPYRNAHGEIVGTIGAVSSIERQKLLQQENEYFLSEARANFSSFIGRSPVIQKVLNQIETVAPTEANVLVLGESGSGKELVARAIHDHSPRKDRPMVRVNCASIPKELFESEFFGHVRGAFTGAIKDRVGRFELADGGTLFLDEVGEIPLDLQGKLLRVLQEGQFERLGEDRTRTVRVRLVAATNRDLLAEARSGRFRLDLYYRLSVFPIELPPLRRRTEDIGLLAEHFLSQSARRLGVSRPRLTSTQVEGLERYDWPGNVRELQNVVERAVILARGGPLHFELPAFVPTPVKDFVPASLPSPAETKLDLGDLDRLERRIIEEALRRSRGKVYGGGGAATMLNIRPTTLMSKMKRLRISASRAGAGS